jgi:hypothetical protein
MRRILSNAVIGILGLSLGASEARAQKTKPIETFTCVAANLQTGRSGIIEITVERWSTDEEREMLLTTLQEFGRDKLLAALEKIRPPVGYMRTANSIGYDLYYARNTSNPDGGRQVVLATNRRVSFEEAANNRRSLEYQLTLIQLQLDAAGKGDGKMVPAAKISWDAKAKRIEIENYRALPVDLINVMAKTP